MTRNQVQAAMKAALAVTECIRELKEVPEGHVYAMVMDHMDLETFEAMIRAIVNTGLVERKADHLLRWKGPTFPEAIAG